MEFIGDIPNEESLRAKLATVRVKRPEEPWAKWKTKLVSMKSGDYFAAPIIKDAAIRKAANNLRKKIEVHRMLVVWMD